MSSALPAVSPYSRRRMRIAGRWAARPESTTHRRRRPDAEQILAALELEKRNDPPPHSAAGARSRSRGMRYLRAIPPTCRDVRRPRPPRRACARPVRSLPCKPPGRTEGCPVLIRRTCLLDAALRPEAARRRAPRAARPRSRAGTIIIRMFIDRRKRSPSQERWPERRAAKPLRSPRQFPECDGSGEEGGEMRQRRGGRHGLDVRSEFSPLSLLSRIKSEQARPR